MRRISLSATGTSGFPLQEPGDGVAIGLRHVDVIEGPAGGRDNGQRQSDSGDQQTCAEMIKIGPLPQSCEMQRTGGMGKYRTDAKSIVRSVEQPQRRYREHHRRSVEVAV